MSNDQPQWNPSGAHPGAGYQWPPNGWGAGGPYGWAGTQQGQASGPGFGAGPQAGRRIDALDVLEGMIQDGFSLSNLTRIARASGSNFWIGAAIGAGLVMLLNRAGTHDAASGNTNEASAPVPAAPGDTPPKA